MLTEVTGAVSGWLSRNGIKEFEYAIQPPFMPPWFVFSLVWVLLFALNGWSAGLVLKSPKSQKRDDSLMVYAVQLIVSFFWPLFFFNLQLFGFAFIWLLLLIAVSVITLLSFRRVNSKTSKLLVPHLLWLLFAAFLNFMTWRLN